MLGARGGRRRVQEAWLRLEPRGDRRHRNLRAWLTTVVARVCLSARAASPGERTRCDDDADALPAAYREDEQAPDAELAQIADSVGVALPVVLETLAPAERIAFVLHDLFEVPFDDIAPIVGATRPGRGWPAGPAVGSAGPSSPGLVERRHRGVVDAFLGRSSRGEQLDAWSRWTPEVGQRPTRGHRGAAAVPGPRRAPAPVPAPRPGARAPLLRPWAGAPGARPALVDGVAGAVWGRRVVRAAFVRSWRAALSAIESSGRRAPARAGGVTMRRHERKRPEPARPAWVEGEIGTEKARLVSRLLRRGASVALAERAEWRMRDIERRPPRRRARGCARGHAAAAAGVRAAPQPRGAAADPRPLSGRGRRRTRWRPR